MTDAPDRQNQAAEKSEGKRVLIGWLSFAAVVAVVIAGALVFGGTGTKPAGQLQTATPSTTQTR